MHSLSKLLLGLTCLTPLSFAATIPIRQADAEPAISTSPYDFIIVGGGTAGLALAARLSEDSKYQVLVVEAGPDPTINPLEEIPGFDFSLEGSDLDWNFTTISQPTLNGRSFLYTRGKCLGGSSVLNFMSYTRGSSSVYNLWSSLGNSGWDWNSVYPYFQRSPYFTPPHTTNNSQITYDSSYYTSSGGPLQLSFGEYTQPGGTYFYPAVQEIGIAPNEDFNGGDALGVAHQTTTINPDGESRSSSYTSFYAQAQSRSNLHVTSSTLATSIILEKVGSNVEAKGVKVQYANGSTASLYANKEVIISAGAFQTPQLLMVSGIGPKAQLQKFGITQYVDLENVGQRLADHATLYVNVEVTTSLPTIGYDLENPSALSAAEAQYKSSATGPLASMNGDIIAFQRLNQTYLESIGATDAINLGTSWPNIEYLMLPAYFNPAYTQPNATGNYVTIAAALTSPSSTGSVTLASADMHTPPVIDVNYYATTEDQGVAIAALENMFAISESSAFAPIYPGREYVVPPASAVATSADMLSYIRNTTATLWHASGTAAMLPQSSGGVVDNELRVYGVSGLRVVDASIQPRITNQHLQAVVYMIAEKAADMIISTWSS